MAEKRINIELGNFPYASPFYSLGREVCQNLYLETAQSDDAKQQYYLLKIPGLRRIGAPHPVNLGACRGQFVTSAGRLYSVYGSKLYELFKNGTKVEIGNLNSNTGRVAFAENGTLMMIVDGTSGYILRYKDANFTVITDEYFPGNSEGTLAPTHLVYIDTYFVCNVPNTNEYYYSESYYQRDADDTLYDYDPLEPNGYWNPINSGKKFGRPDNLTAIGYCNNYLWLFGLNSNEVHYDTGNFDAQLFARYEGAILNVGCNAPDSVATYASNIFWLGTDAAGTLGVFTNDGMQPKRISVRGIEQIIQGFDNFHDCIGYTYAQAGHSFYVMHFPTESRTFVYDMFTNAWHERTFLDEFTGNLYAWKGIYGVQAFDQLIFGDITFSGMYSLDFNYYMNDNMHNTDYNWIRCCKTTPITYELGVNIRYNWLQVIANSGYGQIADVVGVGSDPKIQVAWSNDTGITWSNERTAPLGKQGEYSKRSMVLSCGMGRNRVWRLVMTDPVPLILVALNIGAEPCRF